MWALHAHSIGPGLCGTSENSVRRKPTLGEFTFHEPRRCKNEPHTSRGRQRKLRISEPSQAFDTPLIMPLNNPLIPLPIPSPDVPEPFKAALNVFVAEGQTLDDPRDLTEQTTAQTGF